MDSAEFKEQVFLCVIEIWWIGRRRDTSCRFHVWDRTRTQVGPVVFKACLKNEATRSKRCQRKRLQEAGKHLAINCIHFITIGPQSRAWLGSRLKVGKEEDIIPSREVMSLAITRRGERDLRFHLSLLE